MEKFTQAPVGLDIDQTVSSNSQAIAKVQNGLAYIVGNTNTTGGTLAVGQFVYVKGHSTITEGLRKVTASISANGNITTNNSSACSEGGLNALNSKITSVVSIGNGADLNNYTTPGKYGCSVTAIAQTVLHNPCNEAFYLNVENILTTDPTTGAWVNRLQRLIPLSGQAIYLRRLSTNGSGEWGAGSWYKYTGAAV